MSRIAGAGGRATPLAVLAGIAAVATGGRLLRPSPRHPITADHAVGPAGSSAAVARAPAGPEVAAVARASLAAPLPPQPVQAARGARLLHGDLHRTNRARGHGPRSPKLAWAYEADGPIEAQVTASPDEQTLYVATLAGSLIALGRDGSRRWTLPVGGRAYGAPCVGDDGTIYVGSDAHRFFAVSPAGQVRWTLETDGEADSGAFVSIGGAIVFAAGSTVVAARPSGDLAWRFTAKGKVFAAPAQADDGLIVFGSQDHHAYGLWANGEVAWSTDLRADVDGAPAIDDGGGIFVGTDGGEIVRLDAKGAIVWRTNVGGFVRGSLSVARNGDVLAGVYGPTPRVVRLTAEGLVRGAFAVQGTGAREFGVHGGPLEDDLGTLYFGAQDDALYAVAATGELLWRYEIGDDVDAPVTLLSDGTLVTAADDRRVYAFQP
jgi:outer membrane protein assembly factor BamB